MSSQVYPEFLEPPDYDDEHQSIGVGVLGEFDDEIELDERTGTARQLDDYWRERD